MASELLFRTMEQNKIETDKKTLTIFTPTYNRAYTLHLGYEALSRQTCKDFIWLIVDDGSTDDTLEWVEKWIAERKIDIRYHYQENQGMHAAHNTAYRLIDTELNTCVDSDDYMPDDAVEKIITFWNAHGSKEVAGIIGLDADFQGNLIGTPFPYECRRTTLGGFYAQGGRGDKKLVYRTDVIKQYPEYPIFEGEKYVSLGYKYQLIDQDYPLLALNEVLVNVEYRPDGSSLNMYRQYIRNPRGFAFIRKSSMQLAPTSQRRFIEAMHYVADSLLARNPHFLSESPRKWLTLSALLPGITWYGYIRYKARKIIMISIIVPVYNTAPYLPQCLDSLVNQTYRDIEIICVNDGSTDNSPDILKAYAERDSRILVIHQENLGLSGARNKGLESARGEWVMFVDSDDWIGTDCCKTLLSHTDKQTDVCLFSYIREFANQSFPQYLFSDKKMVYQGSSIHWLYARLIAPNDQELRLPGKIDSLSTAWGKLYKTSLIKEHGLRFVPVRQIGTEDLLFNVYYFTWVKKAIYLPDLFYHYRKNNITSLTKLYKPHLTEQWNLLFRLIEEWITPLHREDLEKALTYRRALSLIGQGLNITFSPVSFMKQHGALSAILSSHEYRTSIRQLPMNYFPIHWRLFFEMARFRSTTGVLCLLKLIKFIIER